MYATPDISTWGKGGHFYFALTPQPRAALFRSSRSRRSSPEPYTRRTKRWSRKSSARGDGGDPGTQSSSGSGHTRAGAGRRRRVRPGCRGRDRAAREGGGRKRRGRVDRKAEMAQNFAQHVGRLDRGDDGHAATAAGACQNVEIENPPHQVRPFPVSRLLGRIRLLRVARILGGGGAGDVGSRRGWVGAGLFRGGGQAFAG